MLAMKKVMKKNILKDRLIAAGLRVKVDDSDNSMGWKCAQYEMKGVPLRVEIGPRDMEAGQCVLVRRSDGVFAYQLAVVVDDAAMGVTEIVRGCDLLGSTPRQIYLQHLLGLPPPHYAHIPLLMSPDGRRLSKRDRDLDLGELRARFGTPEALLGWLAGQTGIAPDATPRTAEQLVEHFSWDIIRAHRENITVTAE